MSGPDFIIFQASRFNMNSGRIVETARKSTSLRDQHAADWWQGRLAPWLLEGDPQGSAYLDCGDQSAFIRWQRNPGSAGAWDRALVLVGDSARLPGTYALELPALDVAQYSRTGPAAIAALAPDGPTGPARDAVAARARTPEAIRALIPALANALSGERRVVLPWAGEEVSPAVAWALLTLLRLTGDKRPVSFRTRVTGRGADADSPGLLVTFRPDVSAPQPAAEHGFVVLATDIAARFAQDPVALGRMLAGQKLAELTLRHDRVTRLLALPLGRPFPAPPPVPPPAATPPPEAPSAGKSSRTVPTWAEPGTGEKATVPVSPGSGGPTVTCPVCLVDIDNWDTQDYWRFDPIADNWEKVSFPANSSPALRKRSQNGAHVRCPNGDPSGNYHYLPARYGRFGEPVLLGFVGLTQSGKSHLLTSMVGRIQALAEYQIKVEPLDPALHQEFKQNSVDRLITQNKALVGTPDRITAMRDAFIVSYQGGPERVVAFFDVSGGDLAETGMGREFLWIADGLFFVVDPAHIARSKAGDETFENVLSIVRERDKPGPKGAAVILNKADQERFEEPAARWLRSGEGTLDPAVFLRESADVYAYLKRHGALALAAPYEAVMCEKATLHLASPTGGPKEIVENEEKEGSYPRGVTPLRVLRPLIAMLAMTGVLTGPQAELIGV